MIGKFTSEEVCRKVEEETELEYKYLFDSLVLSCEQMHIDPQILNKLQALRPSYNVILMTGNMDCFDEFTIPTLKLNTYFDQIVNSYNERQLKESRDCESFRKYCSDLSRATLIDDSQKVCSAFSKAGGVAHRVDADKDISYYLDFLAPYS